MIARLAMAALFTSSAMLACGLPAHADSGCTVGILFAQLIAVGKTHRYGEYLVQLAPIGRVASDPNGAVGPVSVRIDANSADGTTTTLHADGMVVRSPLSRSEQSMSLLVVLPAANVRWFVMDAVGSGPNTGTCDSHGRYVLAASFYVPGTTFDDGAGWVQANEALPIVLDGPKIVYRATPDNPFDSKFSDETDVGLNVTIGADGKLADARIIRSSGDPRVDEASLNAERASRFTAAHLPASYGGMAVAAEIDDVYVFMNQ